MKPPGVGLSVCPDRAFRVSPQKTLATSVRHSVLGYDLRRWYTQNHNSADYANQERRVKLVKTMRLTLARPRTLL